MEIIKITEERMSQILPKTVKDSDLTANAKRVLATIINYYLVNEKVRTTGFLAINNEDLRKSTGIGKDYLKTALQELIECKLVERKMGQKWKAGEKAMASEYRLNFENIRKPIKKPSSDDLLEMLFSTPSETPCTVDSPTILYCSDTGPNTDTYTGPDTNTYTDTNTGPISGTYSDTDSEPVSETETDTCSEMSLGEYLKMVERKKHSYTS